MCRPSVILFGILLASAMFTFSGPVSTCVAAESGDSPRAENVVRFATFNVSFHRRRAGDLIRDLDQGENSKIQRIAEILQIVRPDVVLLNEFDYDEAGEAAAAFVTKYLQEGQGGRAPIEYKHRYFQAVNTGLPSGMDLNNDGKHDGPGDAFGYGAYPGQYGMLVLSKFPISNDARTFQKFLWKDMPSNLLPNDPKSNEAYYAPEEIQKFRLSSKSHWDVPIQVADQTVHFLVSHPTPPVFDGPEDRNGKRNHDEIRLWADYVVPERSDYIYDDNGKRGGLKKDASFVIAGDCNADPFDGDSREKAILQLLNHRRVNSAINPSSPGGLEQATKQGGANLKHHGNAAFDTSDFGDRGRASGNLRVDYVLPSSDLKVVDSGVFWPASDSPDFKLVSASDHRLVWVDLQLEPTKAAADAKAKK